MGADQALAEATANVKRGAYEMKRALRYYDLYLRVCDELTHLEVRNEKRSDKKDPKASNGANGRQEACEY
eukprot:jgi/Pico_ML_1/51403/g2437.t1